MKFPFHCWLKWQGGRTLACHFLSVFLLLTSNPCSQIIKSWLNSELLNRTIKSTTLWKPGRKKKFTMEENLLTNSTSCQTWLKFHSTFKPLIKINKKLEDKILHISPVNWRGSDVGSIDEQAATRFIKERYSYSVTVDSDQINTRWWLTTAQVKGGDPPGNHRPSPIYTARQKSMGTHDLL